MARNRRLAAHRLQNSSLVHVDDSANGPFRRFNPTSAVLAHPDAVSTPLLWRSRDNRKGRHTLLTSATQDAAMARSTRRSAVMRGLARMLTCWPYWDVSFLVAVLFTLGSVVWVLNAFFAYLPLVRPAAGFAHESTAAGLTAFVGATVFEVGSVLLMLEAINENRTACFGWAVKTPLQGEAERLTPDRAGCRHHHHRVYAREHEATATGSLSRQRYLSAQCN